MDVGENGQHPLTPRGAVNAAPAQMRMLEKQASAGAGLAEFEHEPAEHPKLLRLAMLDQLPPLGSATLEGRVDMGEKVIVNIKTFVDGHKPPDRVIESML